MALITLSRLSVPQVILLSVRRIVSMGRATLQERRDIGGIKNLKRVALEQSLINQFRRFVIIIGSFM